MSVLYKESVRTAQ